MASVKPIPEGCKTHVEDVPPDEMRRRAEAAMQAAEASEKKG